MKQEFCRTAMLVGSETMEDLAGKRVAVFGIGGVGGYVAEALARSGIGAIDLVDNDVVALSNLNRQILALTDTIGRPKTEVMAERIAKINPDCQVTRFDCFYLPKEAARFPFDSYDYIVDAVDTVTAKIDIILQAKQHNIPVISSMGTGNKLDPSLLEVADIYETSICPLARVMRRELRARNVESCKVVYSKEEPLKPRSEEACGEDFTERRMIPGSTAFVPASAGLLIASEVIRDFIREKGGKEDDL